MKRILILIMPLLFLFSTSCKTVQKTASEDVTMGASMTAISTIVTQAQLDSVCNADNLPYIAKWKKTTYKDYETGETVCKYIVIVNVNTNRETTYIASGCEEPYKLTKRSKK